MKFMKKALAATMALTLTLSLAACGGQKTAETNDTPDAETRTEYKVGIIQLMDHASLNQIADNIESRLDELGEELGVTFNYADYYQNGQGDSTLLNQIAADMVANEVDIIVPIATPSAMAAQAATEDNQIPIVFAAISDPVSAKLVDSMDAPGTNITGTSDELNTDAIMDLMFAVNPDCDYVGLLYNVSEDSSTVPIADAKAYLDAKGVKYIEKTGTTTDEILLAAQSLVSEGVDAVFTPTDNTVMNAELTIYETLAEAGIPHYCGADSFALNGAFCAYGVDYANLGRETADMIADILVNGADPAATPVKTFDNGLATVNTKTCAALGLDLEEVKAAIEPLCTRVDEITTAQEFE